MEALIIIDAQNDFFEGGTLPVTNSTNIIPVINTLLPLFKFVVFIQDWHPEDHISFQTWPKHCIQNTEGAKLHSEIDLSLIKGQTFYFKKGKDKDTENYSPFFDDTFSRLLKKNKIDEIYILGLAGEYCVKETALDSVKNGFLVNLVSDGIAWIDEKKKNEDLPLYKKQGIWVLDSESIKNFLEF